MGLTKRAANRPHGRIRPQGSVRIPCPALLVCVMALASVGPCALAQTTILPPTRLQQSSALTAPAAAARASGGSLQDKPALGGAGWASLRVPGGTAALLTAAGLDGVRPRATAVLDVIRVAHELPEGIEPAADERRTRLFEYLDTLAEFERTRAFFLKGTVRLSLAENRNTRKLLEEFARALGSSLEREDRTYRIQPSTGSREQQRRAHLLAAGLEVAKLEASLNSGATVTLALPSDETPLPLPELVWRSIAGQSGKFAGALAPSILGDRKASLLYYGLCSMDEATRQYLAATPALLREIYESDRACTIAAYGRSLHVRDGRIDTPGGPSASNLWEAVADERVTRPDRFILKVLARDGGRLALLYDAIAHLDLPGQAFALGLWIASPEQRLDRFRRLYSLSAAALPAWDPAARPFARELYDPGQLLLLTPPTPNGAPRPLSWRKLWEKAFDGDSLPDKPENDVRNFEEDGLGDAAWMIETISLTNNEIRRRRSETWLFGQRVFGEAPRAAVPDVLVALRGYGRFRSLADTLERLGIGDPAVYVAADRLAQLIADIGSPDRRATALSLYQGALVLIERARLSRVIDRAAAGRLVASLGRVPLSDDGEFLGGVAFWIDAEYLPAIGRAGAPVSSSDDLPMETQVLAAIAGRRTDLPPASVQTVEFEGTRYRVDLSAPELARLRAVRAKQRGTSLDSVMGFARKVQAIAVGITSLSQIPAHVLALKSAATPLLQTQKPDSTGWTGPTDLADAVGEAVKALAKMRKPKDLTKCGRLAVPLRRVIDRYLARVLVSLAYACSLGDPEGTALMAGDPSWRHDWGLLLTNEELRIRAPWSIPAETRDDSGHWQVSGSLLALDIALGTQALRRISTEALPRPPTIMKNDRRAFTEAVVLANAFDYRDRDMALIADALRRGRARIAALVPVPAQLAEVAGDAQLDEMRQQLLAWALVHERDRVPYFFSLGDLVRLGRLPTDSVEALDAWGTSGLSYDGRLCLRFPVSLPWTTLSGRRGVGLTPTLVPDLALLAAETLSDLRLPAALTRSILAVATPDLVDRAPLAFEDDWMAMTAEVRRAVSARMDDYVASVMTGGPLVPMPRRPESKRD